MKHVTNKSPPSSPPPPPSTSQQTPSVWKRYLITVLALLSLWYIKTLCSQFSPSATTTKPSPSYLLVSDIPEQNVPGHRKSLEKGNELDRRIIIVGDVHGMFDEFESLMSKVKYNPKSDYLVLSGDIVSKGPDSLEVVDMAIKIGAHCVRGNHEDRILRHYHDLHGERGLRSEVQVDGLEGGGELSPELAAERKLAAKLSKKQAEWLDACPLVVRAKSVPGMGRLLVVHAGLIHGVSLENQDPVAIMTMRTLNRRTLTPSPKQRGIHWAKLWNRKEKKANRLQEPNRHSTVVYGHYAAKGLDIRRYTKGLDSNCVRGGNLSAYIIGSKESGGVREEVMGVKCRKYLD